MNKRSIYGAVIRELLPYILYVTTVFLMANGGALFVFYLYVGKGRPTDNIAEFFLILLIVNFLIFIAGMALIARQLFRYLLPLRKVMSHMDELGERNEEPEDGKSVYYRNVDNKIIGFLEDYKACRLQLEQTEALVQADFMDKLLNAGYKSKNQLLAEAENVRLEIYGFGYLVIVAGIFGNVTDEDVDVDTIYESGIILDKLKQAVEGGGGYRKVWFRKISYRRLLIVLQLGEEIPVEKTLMGLRESFQQKYGVNISWGVSRICRDPLYLWKSMDEANVSAGCCDDGRELVIYSPELENRVKFYLPGVARNNLFSYIEGGNADEIGKIVQLLKTENCDRRNLSHGQFVTLNGKVIRMLEKFKDQDRDSVEEMTDLLNDFVLQDEGSREDYFDLLENCCIRLCRRCVEEKKDKKNRLAMEIKAYIDENYQNSGLSLTQIGAAFNISDSYVSLMFKDYFGVKFSSYLEECRIRHASALLEESDMTVREIAEQTGYASEQSFRRAFKHTRGISPREARSGGDAAKDV